ncbi:hypothetical protein LG324_06030 [Phycicoccus jejuensis]|uniref:hypothetical protein n=1 Tax=Phycicoccus jejuensis TaxID=367299 RepID=UPI00384B33D1
MPSPSRTPGRRRAPGRVRRLPDGLSRRGASWALKSAAGLCVVGGAAVALTVPAELADAETEPTTALAAVDAGVAAAVADRSADAPAARSARREAAPAAVAPAGAAPVRPDALGVAGVTAVAKPKPKPTPKATQKAVGSSATGSSAPAAGSWNGATTSRCSGIGLIPNAVRLCSAVDSAIGPPTIGGRRASADEHGTGQAIDFMTSSAQGDAIAAYVQAHVSEFDVKYLIWKQRYWAPGEGWKLMEDRGSATQNHYDHVHVTVNY